MFGTRKPFGCHSFEQAVVSNLFTAKQDKIWLYLYRRFVSTVKSVWPRPHSNPLVDATHTFVPVWSTRWASVSGFESRISHRSTTFHSRINSTYFKSTNQHFLRMHCPHPKWIAEFAFSTLVNFCQGRSYRLTATINPSSFSSLDKRTQKCITKFGGNLKWSSYWKQFPALGFQPIQTRHPPG